MIKCTAQAFMVEAINYMHAGKKSPLALKTNTETSNHYYFEKGKGRAFWEARMKLVMEKELMQLR